MTWQPRWGLPRRCEIGAGDTLFEPYIKEALRRACHYLLDLVLGMAGGKRSGGVITAWNMAP
jgi:hypothetical protein